MLPCAETEKVSVLPVHFIAAWLDVCVIPQLDGLGREGLARGRRRRLHESQRRRRARAAAPAARRAQAVTSAAAHGRGGQAEGIGERGRHGGWQRRARGEGGGGVWRAAGVRLRGEAARRCGGEGGGGGGVVAHS